MNKKVLKRRVKFVLEPLAKYVLKSHHRRVHQYTRFYEKLPIKKRTILYESRDGKSMTDSPYAMFKFMLESPDFHKYTHIWSIQDEKALKPILEKYSTHPKVKFVKRNSKAYVRFLASSEFLINNSTFPSYYIPKEGQTYINTWHGTPLKKMGYDIPGNPSTGYNVVRNFLCADVLLSPNSHTTDMFLKSYKIDGVYAGKIIEQGYPRIDLTFHTDRKQLTQELQQYGLEIYDQKQTILYAPTWKGTHVAQANANIQQMAADLRTLEQRVGHEYNLLLKVHPFLYEKVAKHSAFKGSLIPDFIDPNELLAAVDMLITDYSSIFFDFLVTGRPILFYTWDADVYTEERGQYLQNSELPGPLLYHIRELAEAIEQIEEIQAQFREKYQAAKERFTNHEDGRVTERVCRHLFQHKDIPIITNRNEQKKKLLIYPGGMRNNGITSSFLNLSHNIDYEKYDVTCILPTSHSTEVLHNIRKLNKKIRLLFKGGSPGYQLFEHYQDKFVHNRGKRGYLGNTLYPEKAFMREHRRLFGNTEFDYVIDFSGYSMYWAKYLLAANAKKKICFMHSDMLADSEKVVNGRRPHRINLRGLFSIYHQFDKLVSVSKGTMEVNRKKLAKYTDPDKFDYVMNSLDPNRIFQHKKIDQPPATVQIESFTSRAIASNLTEIWNTLPTNEGARTYSLPDQQAELLITRKGQIDGKIYYKCSYEEQIIGWLPEDYVTLLPDIIYEEKVVNKIAKLQHPEGKQIWSKPYKISGYEKVSGSLEYKNVIVDVEREVQTPRGVYNRISIVGTVIGWIDQAALHIYDSYTLRDNQTHAEQVNIRMKRKLLKTYMKRKNQQVYDQLHNRPLREVQVMKPLYAKIAHPNQRAIWTHAYPHWQAKKKGSANWLEGELVTIRAGVQTRAGTYYLFYKDEKKVGWVHGSVFEILKEPTMIERKKVKKEAIIRTQGKYDIWTEPLGAPGSTKITAHYDGAHARVDQEVTTTIGTYAHILVDDKPIGWIHEAALEVENEAGFHIEGRYIPKPDPDDINFVHMGRLSPEKGQDQLIKAFAEFHQGHQKSRLYIMGEGALKDDLEKIITELKLEDSVFMLGQVDHPFELMQQCDCFVLSSHYEGQPMVLLEAMTLGMPIIATNIVANRTVLEDGKYGLLVENSIQGLVDGMKKIANQKDIFQPEPFDYKLYNEMAMETFYKPFDS